MLKTRVITAVLLLAVLLPALFYPAPEPFCALALVFITAAGWEWGRLNGCRQPVSVLLAVTCLLLCLAAWALGWLWAPSRTLWLVVGAAWVLGSAALLRAGVGGWGRLPIGLRLAGGVLVLCFAWLAMAQARFIGVNFLLSGLVLVWVADIAAYFAGRALGGRFSRSKLAASISPGKSWEGVWGGMLGVVLLAGFWCWIDQHWQLQVPSLYSRLAAQGLWLLALGAIFLAAMSVVGDLVESLVKRSAGAKDSSGLLPGHGGVLDRVDALLPVLPLVMMLATH